MLHLVNYDLKKPERNYNDLIKAIKAFDCKSVCDSCWVVKSEHTAEQIRSRLQPHIDSNDVLFVSTLSDWAACHLPSDVVDWLSI